MTGTSDIPGKLLILGDDTRRTSYFAVSLGTEYVITVVDGCCRGIEQFDPPCEPDVVMLDFKDKGALHVCRIIRSDAGFLSVPMILLTDIEEVQLGAMEMGAVDCVSREVNLHILKRKLKNLLEWKRAQDAMRESVHRANRKVEELESFIQMVAHDLKSPAVAVSGFVRLLKKSYARGSADPRLEEILHHLSNASDSIHDFVKDISQLLMAEKVELDLAVVNPGEIIRDVVRRHQALLEERNVKLSLDFDDFTTAVKCDRRRMVQVLDNCVLNGVYHMGEVQEPRIRVGLQDQGCYVLVSVSDNGMGIPEQYHEEIFKRFFQVPKREKPQSSGLGLFIARTIVEAHGGRIWAKTGHQGGTTICFTLPKAAGDLGSAPP
ncbi:MAG: ATP-binding protein [Pseudomonadota bacterium]